MESAALANIDSQGTVTHGSAAHPMYNTLMLSGVLSAQHTLVLAPATRFTVRQQHHSITESRRTTRAHKHLPTTTTTTTTHTLLLLRLAVS
jgi:hypothetical protein